MEDFTFLKWSQRRGRQHVGFKKCKCGTLGITSLFADKKPF